MKKLSLIFLLSTTLFAGTVEKIGDAFLLLIPSAAAGATLYHDDREGSIQFAKSFATNAALTYGLKYAIDKTRPNKEDDDSFPSGHTSATFQGASFIHKRYGLKYGVWVYAGALFTAYSRVQADKHYVEDVLVGAALGMASSAFFTSYRGWDVQPSFASKKIGLTISKAW